LPHRVTFEVHLVIEEDSVIRHEFLDERIWAMAGEHPGTLFICLCICANAIAADGRFARRGVRGLTAPA
jgi:hypothetical protein